MFPAGTRGVEKEVPARGEEEGTWSWSFQVCAHHLPGPIKRRRRLRRCHSAASSLGLHFPRGPPQILACSLPKFGRVPPPVPTPQILAWSLDTWLMVTWGLGGLGDAGG